MRSPVPDLRRGSTAQVLGLLLFACLCGDAQAARPKAARPVPPPPAPACRPPAQAASELALSRFRDCVDTPELVRLPAGRFLMGEQGGSGLDYELPVHEVQVPAFSMGRYEVSFVEWSDCHRERFCLTNPDDAGWGRGYRPAINLSWVDTQQYLAWLSHKTGQRYRLPTEAEWEYAARAGTQTSFPWGDASGISCNYANLLDVSGKLQHPDWSWNASCIDGFAYTAPVGSFPPNPWGLHDMAGNVWEWVQDCWHSDYTGAPADGSAWMADGNGDCGKRVNRGGGWGNHPRTLRSAKRDADSATGYGNAFGFRVVREDPPPAPPPDQAATTTTPAEAQAAPVAGLP